MARLTKAETAALVAHVRATKVLAQQMHNAGNAPSSCMWERIHGVIATLQALGLSCALYGDAGEAADALARKTGRGTYMEALDYALAALGVQGWKGYWLNAQPALCADCEGTGIWHGRGYCHCRYGDQRARDYGRRSDSNWQ